MFGSLEKKFKKILEEYAWKFLEVYNLFLFNGNL